jgi:hypothetical protein
MKKKRKISALVVVGIFVCMMLIPSVTAPPETEVELPFWGTEGNEAGKKDVLGTTNNRDLRIITNGEPRMVVTSEGNVGIGVADPQYKLDVDGDVHISGQLYVNSGTGPSLEVTPIGVGIGTPNPTEALDVVGNVHASDGFIAGSTTQYRNGYISLSDGTNLDIDSGTLFIDNANNRVGIGTTSPSGKLEVVGDIVVSGTVDGVDIDVEVDSLHAADASLQGQIDSYSTKQLIQDFVVASGKSVTAGDVVSFLDGYVQKGFKSEYVFNSAITEYISAAALSSTKFVVAFQDYGNLWYGTAVIGDVSGDTITYGSEYVFNSATTQYISAAALSSTKFVVAFQDYGNLWYGTAVIGDVSGNTITYGSKYVFNSADTHWVSAAALSSTKFVVAYRDLWTSAYGTAVIGDVSGDTITYGSEYVFNSASTNYFISAAALSSTKFVVAFQDYANSEYGTAVIGDVSGDTITYGFEYVFNSATTYSISAAALSPTKFVVAFDDLGNSQHGTAVIGDVSGDIITYGLEYVFNSASTGYTSFAALSSTKFVVTFQDYANSGFGTAVIGDVSGNTIIFGSEYVFNSANTNLISTAALSTTKFVVAYSDGDNSGFGTAVIGDISSDGKNICGKFVIGIAKESKTAGQTVPVIIGGVSDIHSGLTPGLIYYSDDSGDLTADQTNCRIGVAISSTGILLADPFF